MTLKGIKVSRHKSTQNCRRGSNEGHTCWALLAGERLASGGGGAKQRRRRPGRLGWRGRVVPAVTPAGQVVEAVARPAAAVPRFGGGAARQVVESVTRPAVRRHHRRRRVLRASSAACGVRGRAGRPRGSQLELTQSRYSQSPQWRMDWFILQRKDR